MFKDCQIVNLSKKVALFKRAETCRQFSGQGALKRSQRLLYKCWCQIRKWLHATSVIAWSRHQKSSDSAGCSGKVLWCKIYQVVFSRHNITVTGLHSFIFYMLTSRFQLSRSSLSKYYHKIMTVIIRGDISIPICLYVARIRVRLKRWRL
jgi:hypothetical protein